MVRGLVFIGHVSVDKIENVNGIRVQPGGAALYAAIAARTLSKNVSLVSAIGRDYPFQDVLKHLDHSWVKMYNMLSTRFHIRYNEKWVANYVKIKWGANPRANSVATLIRELNSSTIAHFSPMKPEKIAKILEKIIDTSPKAKISINTWIGYIKNRKNRRILKELSSKVDFFILNDSEAKALTETDSISIALRLLDAKMVIVTLGRFGAIIKGKNTRLQMVPAFNIPVDKVVDTTGAGDTWCGAFLATYNLTEDLMKSVSVASIISSIKCSDWSFNSLINLRFRKPDDIIDHVIGLKEGSIQKSLIDYTTMKLE